MTNRFSRNVGPDYLDGTLAGDVGLDPLNFVTKYSKGLRVVVPGAETTVEEADPALPRYTLPGGVLL